MHQLDQEQTNASTVPLLPLPPLAIVEGGGQEQTNASTDPGANECINCTFLPLPLLANLSKALRAFLRAANSSEYCVCCRLID